MRLMKTPFPVKFEAAAARLMTPVDSASVGLFRLVFGALLVYLSFGIFHTEYIKANFAAAIIPFPFRLFEIFNLPPLAPHLASLPFLFMGLSSIGIMTGLCFRLSSVTFLLNFLYVFLMDKSFYNDYFYLVLLLTFLLTLTDAHKWPAVNGLRIKKVADPHVPFWQIFILRAQFVIVYFFSGVAKLDYDWLFRAQPMQRILDDKFLFGFPLDQIWIAYALNWAGLLLDLAMAVLLALGKFRTAAFGMVVFFNLINHWLFSGDIGIFPFIMIAGLILFLEPGEPRRWFNKKEVPSAPPRAYKIPYQKAVLTFIIIYLALQILVPLRRFLYPGNPSWSFEGARFSWRLKMNAKKVNLKVLVTDPATERTFEVNHLGLLTPNQQWLDNIPDMILQYVKYIEKEMKEERGIQNPVIHVAAEASFNDRPTQAYIDKTMNFTGLKYPLFSHADWIIPLKR